MKKVKPEKIQILKKKTAIFYKKATVPLVKKYSTLSEGSSKLNPH